MKRLLHTATVVTVGVAAILLLGAASGSRLAEGDDEPLRVAFLPTLDALPLHIAESEGYFADAGVVVESIIVSSPVERDQLFQAGEIDGMLNELSTTAIFNGSGTRLQTILTVRRPVVDGPVFRILAAPGSGMAAVEDLRNVSVGISMNTIIEYLTFRLLSAGGLAPEEISMVSVPVIPERFQLLMRGDLAAATLPDPLAEAAIQAGAVLVLDDTSNPEYSVSVLSFSSEVIQASPTRIARFVEAWNRAVETVNREPEAYRGLFLEKVQVPEAVRESYSIPRFPLGEVPNMSQWNDVLDWLEWKGLIDSKPTYEESILLDYIAVSASQ